MWPRLSRAAKVERDPAIVKFGRHSGSGGFSAEYNAD